MKEADLIAETQSALHRVGYIAERSLASSLVLFDKLQRPLLLEGHPGVGKTEIALALSQMYQTALIRLQCYEGLDTSAAVYEWNYQHQLLSIKLLEARENAKEENIFSREYLLERPLLRAISQPVRPVLLIDEIDRADEEFEAFLLELLADFQITIPELGTIKATSRPLVVLTSNGTRNLSDALRRRCLYHYIEFPPFDKELSIVLAQLPEVGPNLARQVVSFVQELRKVDLNRKPGIAETLDWAAALMHLGISSLTDSPQAILDSMVCLLKTREDNEQLTEIEINQLVTKAA